MKANTPKRKIFNDALDVLCGEDIAAPVNGIEMLPIDSVHPFRKHPFRLYEGERLDDMVESIREHGILSPLIVLSILMVTKCLPDITGRMRAGLTEIPVIVKRDLSEKEA